MSTVSSRGPRRANADDAEAIAELWLRSRRASAGIPPASHDDAEVHAWFRDVVLPTREVWVIETTGSLTATIVLDAEWIEQLYVAPERLRQGCGSQLLDVARATRDSLLLWTFVSNAPARAFYEKHGFEPDGAPSSDNEERGPAIRYRWSGAASGRA